MCLEAKSILGNDGAGACVVLVVVVVVGGAAGVGWGTCTRGSFLSLRHCTPMLYRLILLRLWHLVHS